DVFAAGRSGTHFVGNGLWEPCLEAGCKIHSLSIGADSECSVGEKDVLYDDFMYNNPENLVVVAAGNDGDIEDGRTVCTMNSPAIGKNALAVGATSSGETRLTKTSADGDRADGTNGYADVDTVAVFSSYGPTQDGRIKPEVVAPGDAVRMCVVRLISTFGTSNKLFYMCIVEHDTRCPCCTHSASAISMSIVRRRKYI
ncbi:unnamed protein product, partial [Scytosiphon promiscuus]